MYKRLFKIFSTHIIIILFWGFLYKTGNIIAESPILNGVSIALIMILYLLIYTEISNKNIPRWASYTFTFMSLFPFTIILANFVNYQIVLGTISLVSITIYMRIYMNYSSTKKINILPISKHATNLFAIFVLIMSILIIHLFEIDSFMINVYYQLIFLVIESFFVLFLKEKEDTYEKNYRLYYLSDYMTKERDEFARIIHDDIIQDVFACRNYLSLKNPDKEKAKDVLNKLEEKARDIMKFYQSNLFEKANLEASISAIFNNVASLYSNKNIKIEKKIDAELLESTNKNYIRLISIVSKELINNVYKHSNASFLNYRLYKNENLIVIEIYSNGASKKDFRNIKESKRGVLLLNLLIDSNSGNISYELDKDILSTTVILEADPNENSFVR